MLIKLPLFIYYLYILYYYYLYIRTYATKNNSEYTFYER